MIDVDGVTVAFGDTTVLSDVSVGVSGGSLVGLVGPNGAGKTTLLRTINGRIEPRVGTVSVDGEPIERLPARAIGRRIAAVPQDPAVAFEFTVREFVEMGRYPHRSRLSARDPNGDLIDAALEWTDTAALADRAVTTLSGGERQRALLARALAQDAPVLLLDEPTASLDVNHQIRTLELVRELVDSRDRTVLAAIHDLDLAARYCDELVLLADEAIRAAGPPDSVLTEPALTAAFGGRVTVGRDPVLGTQRVTTRPDRTADRDGHVHVVCGGGSATGLLARLDEAGYGVTVGPLPASDPDVTVAEQLGLEVVTAPPHTPVDAAVEPASKLARAADVVLLADLDVGSTNRAALDVCPASPRLVMVGSRPIDDRVHDDEGAKRRIEQLRRHATIVSEPSAVPAAVEDALAAPTPDSVPAR